MSTSGDPQQPNAPQGPYDTAYGQAVAGAPRGSGRAALALTALILAGVAAIGSLAVSLVTLALMAGTRSSFATVGAFGGITTIVFLLLAVAALVLGIIAARGSRPVMAGVAIGIAAAQLLSSLYGLLAPALSMLMYP